MMTKEQREAAIREFNEACAKERAEREAKEAAALAARPKATVIEMPLEEEVRRAILNGRGGRWEVVPHGVTAYRPDGGPTREEWEFVQAQRRGSSDPHEAYSRSLYGPRRN
jgi:hypothetical protein